MKKYNIGLLKDLKGTSSIYQDTNTTAPLYSKIPSLQTALEQNNPDDIVTPYVYFAKPYRNNQFAFNYYLGEDANEMWFSLNLAADTEEKFQFYFQPVGGIGNNLPWVHTTFADNGGTVKFDLLTSDKNILYTPPVSEVAISSIKSNFTNIEVHYKTGDEGRADLWINHKLVMSYRDSSHFPEGTFSGFNIYGVSGWEQATIFNSFIISNEGRIGYEKFHKLTIDPSDEQTLELNQTVEFTLSGVSYPDSSTYTEITGVHIAMEPISRDANILSADITLDGEVLGSVDVSDSSGAAYEIIYSHINPKTSAKWVPSDLEGKTLTITASSKQLDISE